MRVLFGIYAMSGLLAFGGMPMSAHATPITPTKSAQGNVAFYNANTSQQIGSSVCFAFSTGATTGCSGTTTTPTTGSSLNYLTTATADYGVLKAGGRSSNSGASGTSNTTDYSSAYGQAYFEDSWTITGGTGTGTLGLQFALDGSYDFCSAGSGAVVGFSLVNLDNFSFSNGTPGLTGCSGAVSKTVLLTTGFTFGTAVDFLVSLTAGSNIYDLGKNVSSFLDLSNTAIMTAIIVKDANGDVIPFDLATASKAPLFDQLAPGTPPVSPVPEPGSLELFAAGIAALALMGLGRRVRS